MQETRQEISSGNAFILPPISIRQTFPRTQAPINNYTEPRSQIPQRQVSKLSNMTTNEDLLAQEFFDDNLENIFTDNIRTEINKLKILSKKAEEIGIRIEKIERNIKIIWGNQRTLKGNLKYVQQKCK